MSFSSGALLMQRRAALPVGGVLVITGLFATPATAGVAYDSSLGIDLPKTPPLSIVASAGALPMGLVLEPDVPGTGIRLHGMPLWPTIAITRAFPNGTVGTAYSASLAVFEGATGATIVAGTAPPGLSLTFNSGPQTITLAGTPT